MAKLIVLDEGEFVKNFRSGMTKLEKVYKCGDKRFRIRYEMSNGSPLGFNYKKCLSQYNGEEWKNLDDMRSVRHLVPTVCNNYYSETAVQECIEFFAAMEKRILKIYA